MPILYPFLFLLTAVLTYQAIPTPQPVPENFGVALPAAPAVFETSLAAPITSSATTMTMAANSVRGGGSLTGYNCFTVDEGSAQAEFVCGTVSGTTVSSLTRGVSPSTGTSTVAALQFSHRRGASVKVTDFPVIQILKALAAGEDTFPANLIYAAGITPTSIDHIVDKGYVDALAFSGAAVIDATTAARGVVELATAAEAAASTANGGSGVLTIPASIATSTYNASTAATRVLLSGAGGLLDPKFVFNGLSFTFPAAQGASSTVLSTNGSGAMTFVSRTRVLEVATSSANLATMTTEQPIFGTYIPANIIGPAGGSVLRYKGYFRTFQCASGVNVTIRAYYGSTNFASIPLNCGTGTGNDQSGGSFEATIIATSSTAIQRGSLVFQTHSGNPIMGSNLSSAVYGYAPTTTPFGQMTVDSTAQQQFRITIQYASDGGNDVFITEDRGYLELIAR